MSAPVDVASLRARLEAEYSDAADPRAPDFGSLEMPRPWVAFYSERNRSWRVHDAEGALVVSHLSQRDAEDIAKAGS